MKKIFWIFPILWLVHLVALANAQVPPLPAPVSNNAVASLKIG